MTVQPRSAPQEAPRSIEIVGRLSVDLGSEKWWWSDEIYQLHGFRPGDVIPTTELMLAHREAAEGPLADRALRNLVDTVVAGDAIASTYRLIDATGRQRTVAVVGCVREGAPGTPREFEGYMVDLTPGERARLEEDVRDAVTSFRSRAATIEQAKGILMELFGLPADDAFDVLRDHSNKTNVKLFALAERLVRADRPQPIGVSRPRVGDAILARRLGIDAGERTDAFAITLRWRTPRRVDVSISGAIEESDVPRIDETFDIVLRAYPNVLAVRLDLHAVTAGSAALPSLRRALVRLHHAGTAVEVVGDAGALGAGTQAPAV